MPRNKRLLLTTLLWLVAVGTLAYLGNSAGHLLARAGYFRTASGPASSSVESDVGRPERQRRQAAPATDKVDKALERLRSITRNSASVHGDWEARLMIQDVLSGLNAAELGLLFMRLEVQDEIGGVTDLTRAVGVAWATLDPDAAIAAALAKSRMRGEFFAVGIIRDWGADHPREALAWLNGSALDPTVEKTKEELKASIVSGLVERDFDLAKGELAKMDPNESKRVIDKWGRDYVVDAAIREKLVEYTKSTGNPADFAALNQGMVRAWPENDPLGLMNHLQDLQTYLESDAVPAAARPETDAAAVGIAIRREYHDVALEWWMDRYSRSTEAPAPLRQAMNEWTRNKTAVATHWLANQQPSPQRDALSAAAAPVLLSSGKFNEAAELIGNINDPALRLAGTERLEMFRKDKDPSAAEAWKKSP